MLLNQKEIPMVLSDSQLYGLIRGQAPCITSRAPGGIVDDQIQPSSIDLTLGTQVFGMGAARLPRNGERLGDLTQAAQYKFVMEPDGFLHPGYVYVVPLNESLMLPRGFSAKFSPKSSTGRIDVFVRVLADGVSRFDHVPDGYRGDLYLEITPLSFPVYIRPGLALVQVRIRAGDARLSGHDIMVLQASEGIILSKGHEAVPTHELKLSERGVYVHVDLDRDIVGFVARKHVSDPLDLSLKDAYDPLEFYEPIPRPKRGLAIDPDRFYLLVSKEPVCIPVTHCGDIAPYDASTGEFRTHYAGFFDPGFGKEEGGTECVLEVRGREAPHRLFDNDPICLMTFEQVGGVAKPYRGHYLSSGPSLSKHFKNRYEVWGAK